jgi:spermidine synthase
VIQITERDGDSYNEMMAHIPMFLHPNPKRVLIVGGGDGYVLSEVSDKNIRTVVVEDVKTLLFLTKDTFFLIQVLKHDSVVHVDHVDLDEEVIETCKNYFKWGSAWEDPRAHLHIEDGAKFVREAEDGFYDVIIQDSSDPWSVESDGRIVELPSAVLYEEAHFRNMHRILTQHGVLNLQVSCFLIGFPGTV